MNLDKFEKCKKFERVLQNMNSNMEYLKNNNIFDENKDIRVDF